MSQLSTHVQAWLGRAPDVAVGDADAGSQRVLFPNYWHGGGSPDVAVGGAAAAGQQTVLVQCPGQHLDSRSVHQNFLVQAQCQLLVPDP